MADESILDKAAALIPGVGGGKGKADSRRKQLEAIHKKLAALAKDVEKLAATIATETKDAGRKSAAKKPVAKAGTAAPKASSKAAPTKTPRRASSAKASAEPASEPKVAKTRKKTAARKPASDKA